ncbi:hypothetical protein NM688_g1475 [Phlebia brevispora]|uniref:Uncharacterized protein n=1 Tax=Phlebia brevispora TaxID=194682 RepID=A0ACC1TB08_9APHY|nr:hypothetical protein NM688_g1475 [Phlebia brevispora]
MGADALQQAFENQSIATEPPPSYTATAGAERPPAYSPPSSYRIGAQTLSSPFVTIEQLKAHLSLLKAFKQLKTVVDEGKDARIPEFARSMEPLPRWGWFVGLAVERFQRWLLLAAKVPMAIWVQQIMPPLDVLMVWHSYLLNPFWYAEDTTRLPILSDIRSVNDYLLQSIVYVGDISTYEAPLERKSSWLQQTGTPFDPLDAAEQMTYHEVECPQCLMRVSVPFLTPEGTGYSQHQFAVGCSSCKFMITKENLAVLKYARDIILDPENPGDVQSHGKAVFLPGTLRTPVNPLDERVAGVIKMATKIVFGLKEPPQLPGKKDWLDKVMKHVEFSMVKVRAATTVACTTRGRRALRIVGAYTDDRPFSIDLVGAVIRQGSFVDKMHNFGWTETGYFDSKEDEAVLVHSIARYHAFLDLMSSTPTSFFVPTLDIDLAWHTHQMMAINYNNDCAKYIKRYIDHDDKIEEDYLANKFDLTCRAWQASTV